MKWIISVTLLCASYSVAPAVGSTDSQQVVCHIAHEYLNDGTKAKLEALLSAPLTKSGFMDICSKEPNLSGGRAEKYQYLQDEAVGSDTGKALPQLTIQATRNLPLIGYTDLPRDTQRISNFECPKAATCLMKALLVDTQILGTTQVNADEYLDAINRISWHIARLHFPLSFGFSDDLGGHWVRVGNTEICARNLNGFWANCSWKQGLVNRALAPDDIEGYAEELHKEVTQKQEQKWLSGGGLLAWANQSFRIATSNRMGYCLWRKNQCRYSDEKLSFDPNNQMFDQYSRKVFVGRKAGVATQRAGLHNMAFKKLLLDDEYKVWANEVMETRFKQAGVRLAAFLAASL